DAVRGLVARLPRPNDRSPRLSRLREWGSAVFAASLARPRRTLWIAGAVAVLGWGLGTQVEVVNDLTRLAPSDRQEVKDADTLRDFARSAGQVSVLVRGRDLSDPRAIAWMADYQGRVPTRHGYSERPPGRSAQPFPGLPIQQ